MLFTFPAETDISQMDLGSSLPAEPRGAGVGLPWEHGPFAPPQPPAPPVGSFLEHDATCTGELLVVTGQSHHQHLWLLMVFLHTRLIFPLVPIRSEGTTRHTGFYKPLTFRDCVDGLKGEFGCLWFNQQHLRPALVPFPSTTGVISLTWITQGCVLWLLCTWVW